jgi:hypothetical protein
MCKISIVNSYKKKKKKTSGPKLNHEGNIIYSGTFVNLGSEFREKLPFACPQQHALQYSDMLRMSQIAG